MRRQLDNIHWVIRKAYPAEMEISKEAYIQAIEEMPVFVWQDDAWEYWAEVVKAEGPSWIKINAWVMENNRPDSQKISINYAPTGLMATIDLQNSNPYNFDEEAIEIIFQLAARLGCKVFNPHLLPNEFTKEMACQMLEEFREKHAALLREAETPDMLTRNDLRQKAALAANMITFELGVAVRKGDIRSLELIDLIIERSKTLAAAGAADEDKFARYHTALGAFVAEIIAQHRKVQAWTFPPVSEPQKLGMRIAGKEIYPIQMLEDAFYGNLESTFSAAVMSAI